MYLNTVDDIKPCITLRTLSYGSYGVFLVRGNAAFASSTVLYTLSAKDLYGDYFKANVCSS